MATTISILNMKGGVGKTTLAVNLAWYLCRDLSHRVLLVDLDPQFNASQYVMDYSEWEKHKRFKGTVADLLLEPTRASLTLSKKKKKSSKTVTVSKYIFTREITPNGGKFDLLPAELGLSAAVKNPDRVNYKLENALKAIQNQYDYIFIDCAPTDSVLTDTALMASDYVLVPVKPDRFSVLGHAQILTAIDSFKESTPDPHEVEDLGVVFMQVQEDDIVDQCMNEVKAKACHSFDTQIRVSKSYLRAVQEQTPVIGTRYAKKLTRSAIRDLFVEIEDRIADLEDEE